MEFKFPKKITVGDTFFKIKYNKKESGASFQYPHEGKAAHIEFGTESLSTNPLSFLNSVVHEFKEIIQVEQCSRMGGERGGEYKFFYGHDQHSDLCARLARILSKFIK